MKVSLYCPKMSVSRDGFLHRMTAEEPMMLTCEDGTTFTVTIPPTPVQMHFLRFPDVATVAACTGQGQDAAGNVFIVSLPSVVAKAIVAFATLRYADGLTYQGNVTFPDCLFSGGNAQPVTAAGNLEAVS